MAVDKKITDFDAATTFSPGSWFLLVDPTNTSMDPTGTNLKIQAGPLVAGLLPTQTSNSGKYLTTDGTTLSWGTVAGGGGSGTVTSVAMTVPSWMSVSGSPVTTSGTLALSVDPTTANRVLATPDGASGTLTPRALVAADIPNLPASQITTGTISTARLGSGTASASKFLQGDQTWATLNQAAVAGLTTTDSPTFAGLTVGATSGILKRTSGVVGNAVSGTDYEPPITAGTTSQYLKGDKSLGTLNQAAVAGLTTASSPTFAGATIGSLSGVIKATAGVLSAAVANTDYLTSSFAGTSSIVTVGTIGTGTWQGTTIAVANGGTGQTTASAAINALVPSQATNSGKVLGTNGTSVSWVSTGGTGTVTSVDLTVPSWLTVSGNPVTATGTLAVVGTGGLAGNQIIATPDGTTGAVSLRAMTANDVPSLPASQITSGTMATARLGSGTANSTKYLAGDQTWGTLNQAAVAGLTTASSPAFAGLTVGSLTGLLKASSGVISAATAGTDYLTSSYAGTSSIVTVGTITSGTWTGTTIAIANGGTGATSASAAFNALSPNTTLGDLTYGSGTNTSTRLAGNTTGTKKFLRQTGTGSVSAAPAWDTIVAADVPTMVASGASHAPGIVPDPPSSSGSTKFLREDATWAIPAGGGGSADNLGLTPTAVKTSGYTAAAGQFVPCDSTSGGFTVTLPTAPADGTLIAVKHTTQGSTNSITVAAGGSDVFNRAGGSTTLTLPALARGVIVQYNSALAIWYVMTRDFGAILAADVPTLAASQVTAPGSTTQITYNNAGALAGAANIAVGSSGQLSLTPISDPGSPAAGDLWFDTAWKSLSIRQAGVISRLGGIIWQATGAGTAIANTTTATSLLSGATTFGTLTIPANSLTVGKILRPTFFGTWGGTGTPNLTFKLTLGGVVIGQGTSAMTAQTGKAWTTEGVVGPGGWQVQSIGATGTILGIGRVNPSGGTAVVLNTSGTTLNAASAATIDTTTSLTLDFTAQWGAASASNTIQLLGGWVEILG